MFDGAKDFEILNDVSSWNTGDKCSMDNIIQREYVWLEGYSFPYGETIYCRFQDAPRESREGHLLFFLLRLFMRGNGGASVRMNNELLLLILCF